MIKNKTLIAVIPAYEPPINFECYVKELLKSQIDHVIVVNDGSSTKYDGVFYKISQISNLAVLSYGENHGKGYALKFAFKYILENYGINTVIVTADCDGQHAVSDVLSVANSIAEGEKKFALGVRNFSLKCVPKRSKFGNLSTRRMLRLLYGYKITDTQTGLRAFSGDLSQTMISLDGDRFEYEMNQLILLPEYGIQTVEVPIQTIYGEKQEGTDKRSHFKTFSDSYKVWKFLLKGAYLKILTVLALFASLILGLIVYLIK